MVNATIQDGPRPDTVSRRTDSLVASVSQHQRAISAHQHQLLGAVAELDRRKAWRIDGATTMVSWLVQRCSVTASTAREWVTAAEKLESLPKISEALSQGKLSFDQIKPLVQVAKPDTDARLAEAATQWSAKQVKELAVAAQRQSDSQAAGSYSRRSLRFDDRRRSFSGVLPEDHYARVKGALTADAARRPKIGTTFEQRMADAFVERCGFDQNGGSPSNNGGSKNGGSPSKRTTVVVHADLTFLAGGEGSAELDVLGPLSPEVVRRLACDAKIILSADNEKGHSIQQGGAQRNPTSGQRLEIRRRDKGCRFPGCTYTEFTDVHHVVHWLNGGPTAIPNLVTLCDQHHRAVHELGWKMSGDANVLLTFRSPTGRVTTSTPSPTFTPARARPPD
jgi:5-methylcytosine-specific restriction endonuclease McrA